MLEVILLTGRVLGSSTGLGAEEELRSVRLQPGPTRGLKPSGQRQQQLEVPEDVLSKELRHVTQHSHPVSSGTASGSFPNAERPIPNNQIGFGNMPLGSLGYSPEAIRILVNLVRNVERQMIKSGAVQKGPPPDAPLPMATFKITPEVGKLDSSPRLTMTQVQGIHSVTNMDTESPKGGPANIGSTNGDASVGAKVALEPVGSIAEVGRPRRSLRLFDLLRRRARRVRAE